MGILSQVAPGAAPQVRELHIDFLLEEEFSAEPNFLEQFLAEAGKSANSVHVEWVQRSVADNFGEADLVVVYRNEGGPRIACLIEDKLRAGFQRDQSDRYRQRGSDGIGEMWDEFWTCLIAPQAYIQKGHSFDTAISLESVIAMLGDENNRRSAFKRKVLHEAIQKCESIGVQIVDPVMTAFRAKHFAWFQEFFREELSKGEFKNIRPPAPTYKGDTWFEVRSPLLPRGAYLNHKSPMGAVDLSFPNTRVSLFESFQSRLEAGMILLQTGKSTSIRIPVMKVFDFQDFDAEQPKFVDAGNAMKRLLAFYTREKLDINSAIK